MINGGAVDLLVVATQGSSVYAFNQGEQGRACHTQLAGDSSSDSSVFRDSLIRHDQVPK